MICETYDIETTSDHHNSSLRTFVRIKTSDTILKRRFYSKLFSNILYYANKVPLLSKTVQTAIIFVTHK